jgi:hypothetical protein
MKVIDAQKFRDFFYYGVDEKPIISTEVDAVIIEAIERCTVEIDEQRTGK